jgi:hypothetical protein
MSKKTGGHQKKEKKNEKHLPENNFLTEVV